MSSKRSWFKWPAIGSVVFFLTLGGATLSAVAAVTAPHAEIVMTNKMFKVTKGGGEIGQPMFRLEAGKYASLTLRNADNVAHEFVSPLFRMTELQLEGQATIV